MPVVAISEAQSSKDRVMIIIVSNPYVSPENISKYALRFTFQYNTVKLLFNLKATYNLTTKTTVKKACYSRKQSIQFHPPIHTVTQFSIQMGRQLSSKFERTHK